MSITVGATLPDATFLVMGANGPEPVELASKVKGRKVVIFGLPGAFTGPCTTSHLPSFMRTREGFAAKGVEEIICVAVNDPFVLKAWGEATGATEAGITLLGDAETSFTKALGMDFSAPHLGLIDRSTRYALVAEDGVITHVSLEEVAGACDLTTGERLLEKL